MKILFVCKSNQFRSQMASALYNKLTGTNDADSAGTNVGTEGTPEGATIDAYFRTPDFFELMEENGMNVRGNTMKKVTPEMIEKFDVVVSMAEEPFIPDFLRENKRVQWWGVENPPFATREVSEQTFKQMKSLVKELI